MTTTLLSKIERVLLPCRARLEDALKKPEVVKELKQRFNDNRHKIAEALHGKA